MFLFRWVKNIIFMFAFFFGFWALANYEYKGKTLLNWGKEFASSPLYKEGVKDIKVLVGGALKSVGEDIQEDISEQDKKRLQKVIKKHLKEKRPKELEEYVEY